MSELINTSNGPKDFRRLLLSTVPALAFLASVATRDAKAADDDVDRPMVWIELGGQLSRMDDGQEAFAPVFPNSPPRPSIFFPSQKFERLPLYSLDETGKVSFEPDDFGWVFSASVRYGQSISKKDVNQQTYPKSTHFYYTKNGVQHSQQGLPNAAPLAARVADTSVQNGEHHLILDFQAGKDVGLGMFGGRDGLSNLGFGVRFAQFGSTSNVALKSDPDWHRLYKYLTFPAIGVNHEKVTTAQPYHSNVASLRAARSFHGIGPSISWNASAPFSGNARDGEFLFDWGANAALLFGRQKATIHHQSTVQYHPGHTQYGAKYRGARHVVFSTNPPDHIRSRSVTVPDVGGFAGITLRRSIVKISVGYRADLFFGAMDGGIDAAKSENRGFCGPFASVSVGIGG